jgi:hypothetical protein
MASATWPSETANAPLRLLQRANTPFERFTIDPMEI